MGGEADFVARDGAWVSTSSVDHESVRLVVDVWAIGDVIVAVGLTDASKHCRSKGKEAQYIVLYFAANCIATGKR